MTVENIATIINYIETKYEVDKWEIDGIKIWPFIRMQNYSLLSYQVLNASPIKTRSLAYAKKVLKSKFQRKIAEQLDSKMNVQFSKAEVVLFSNGVSFSKIGSKYYDRFCDPIYDYYKMKGIKTIRLELNHKFFTPKYSPSKFIQPEIDNIIIRSLISNNIYSRKCKNEQWNDYELFQTDTFVKKHLANVPEKNDVRAKINKIKNLRNYFIPILKRINPKLAFIVNYYNDTGMAILLACKSLNITTVDIQHGVQGDLHLAYGNWTKVPINGFSSLPDYFWVWSQLEKNAIDKWNMAQQNHNPIIGGNLFSDVCKRNQNSFIIKYEEQFLSMKKVFKNPSILVSLSPNNNFINSLHQIIRNTKHKYNWFIRLHPTIQNNSEIFKKHLKKNGIDLSIILDCSNFPLYSVLKNIDLHITAQSSVVIEAAEFGVKSIIISTYGQSLFKEYLHNGSAVFCEDLLQLQKMIDVQIKENKLEVNPNNTNIFDYFDPYLGDKFNLHVIGQDQTRFKKNIQLLSTTSNF